MNIWHFLPIITLIHNIYASEYLDNIKRAEKDLEQAYDMIELEDCSKCEQYIAAVEVIFKNINIYLDNEAEPSLAILFDYYHKLSKTIGALHSGYYYENTSKGVPKDKLIPPIVDALHKKNTTLHKKIYLQEGKTLGFSDSISSVHYKCVKSYRNSKLRPDERTKHEKLLSDFYAKNMYSYAILLNYFKQQLNKKAYEKVLENITHLNTVIKRVKYRDHTFDELVKHCATSLRSQKNQNSKQTYLKSFLNLIGHLKFLDLNRESENRYMCLLFEPAYINNSEYKAYYLDFYHKNKEDGFGFLKELFRSEDRYKSFMSFINNQIELDKLKSDSTKSLEK